MGVWRIFTLFISLSDTILFAYYSSVCFPYASGTNRHGSDTCSKRSSIMTCDLSLKFLEVRNYFAVLKRFSYLFGASGSQECDQLPNRVIGQRWHRPCALA